MVGEGNKAFLTRVWKPFPSRRVLEKKNLKRKPEWENPKRTNFVSGGLDLLQIQYDLSARFDTSIHFSIGDN